MVITPERAIFLHHFHIKVAVMGVMKACTGTVGALVRHL